MAYSTNPYLPKARATAMRLQWRDEQAHIHEQDFDGFLAHVIQHEVDHLNGVLFVDKVEDTESYKTFKEYMKMCQHEQKGSGPTGN
jgi:peptide deformylase